MKKKTKKKRIKVWRGVTRGVEKTMFRAMENGMPFGAIAMLINGVLTKAAFEICKNEEEARNLLHSALLVNLRLKQGLPLPKRMPKELYI
jgi:hypothetical protein